MLVTVLLVAVLAMDSKCAKAASNIEVLYVYEYLVQLHSDFAYSKLVDTQ